MSDVAPLAELRELQFVDLDDTCVTDVRPLGKGACASTLVEVSLAETRVADVACLARCVCIFLDLYPQAKMFRATRQTSLKAQARFKHCAQTRRHPVHLETLLHRCANLWRLDLSGTKVTAFGALGSCVRIRHLALSHTPLDSEALEAVLEEMVRGGTDGHSPSLETVPRTSQLRRVEVAHTEVSDRGARALATWCTLLEHVDLSYTRVGSVGVRALASACTKLRIVDLAATNVLSDGVRALRECVSLRRVVLDWTGVTREDADALRSARPRVYVSLLGV